jgi:hypothetical protein
MKNINRKIRSLTTLTDYHEAQHQDSRNMLESNTSPEILGGAEGDSESTPAPKSVNDVTNIQRFVTLSEAPGRNFVPENYENGIPDLFF